VVHRAAAIDGAGAANMPDTENDRPTEPILTAARPDFLSRDPRNDE
jgi:hypothetical protein